MSASEAAAINALLRQRLRGRPSRLYAAAAHLIEHGGKRFRPYMLIKSCQALGGKKSDAMPAATAIEMIHNFTLLHDDIMDNDSIRHGVPTVHKKFGVPVAILAGDVLFSKAYQVISGPRVPEKRAARLTSRLAAACVDVCEGQLYDMDMAEGAKLPTRSEYIMMIGKKTASLFGAACAMGAICSGADEKDARRFAAFGTGLGVAFQITDDLIGITGDPKVTKKPVGNDIREGKKSLPVLMALKKARGKDRAAIRAAFGNARATSVQLRAAVSAVKSLGIEDDVRREAGSYAKKASSALDRYPGRHRDDLLSLLDCVVWRRL
ncbi:geranylgeranyl pyrophosphate synthase/geranyltranstransferase [Cenarchaeum symbiosum A]|uniref:Geranylgeranyl pyrophosphate synthase/geranyltranstransferase n=1 Tax=Cenarchaeum symbiosum (strain A) TaxID=414004 RepID=A0RY19_CENSY|nr:geranylgeranyl pyrophosphate synthase/geranyltranstransferase [Cenarchaeum symbiosum A]